MNTNDWTEIPARLKAAGFTVKYDRVSYDPVHPLWCARASREGREWTTSGKNLGAALLELEKETQEIGVSWHPVAEVEKSGRAPTQSPVAN